MKNFLFLIFILTAACGSGGGSASPHVPDHSLHDYTIVFSSVTNTSNIHTGTLTQYCSDGARNETQNFTLVDPNNRGGIGCGSAFNVILTARNTSANEVLEFYVTKDNVTIYVGALQPNELYTYQAGY
jgi:hypothetical protein